MFQMVEKPWETIVRLLSTTKYDFYEFDKAMFLGVGQAMRTHFLLPGHPTSDFEELMEMMFQVYIWPWELIIYLLGVFKCVYVEVDEAMFRGVEGLVNSFSEPGHQ
jgi:hypothetical protein